MESAEAKRVALAEVSLVPARFFLRKNSRESVNLRETWNGHLPSEILSGGYIFFKQIS